VRCRNDLQRGDRSAPDNKGREEVKALGEFLETFLPCTEANNIYSSDEDFCPSKLSGGYVICDDVWVSLVQFHETFHVFVHYYVNAENIRQLRDAVSDGITNGLVSIDRKLRLLTPIASVFSQATRLKPIMLLLGEALRQTRNGWLHSVRRARYIQTKVRLASLQHGAKVECPVSVHAVLVFDLAYCPRR
jgi:hypothetical protein